MTGWAATLKIDRYWAALRTRPKVYATLTPRPTPARRSDPRLSNPVMR